MAKANGEGAADRLKQQGGNGGQKPATIKDFILQRQDSIRAALPQHVNVERFTRIVLVTVSQTPRLLQCTPISLLTATMQAAQLGLEPGPLGQCYLLPYWNKKIKRYEVQFQIGYKGLIELCRRSGVISSIAAHEVCEHDEFDYQYGFEERLVHRPAITEERGQPYAYYAYAVLKDGGRAMELASRADIEAHRDRYSQSRMAGKSSPWDTEFDEMAKKTMVKKLLKYLPVSVELLESLSKDETVVSQMSEREAPDIDLEMFHGAQEPERLEDQKAQGTEEKGEEAQEKGKDQQAQAKSGEESAA